MFKIGTKVRVKQPAILENADVMGNLKLSVNTSPLRDATGTIMGKIKNQYYLDMDNEHLFSHRQQNGLIAVSEENLELV